MILDIGQAVIHETLSLGILVGDPARTRLWSEVMKDLLLAAHDLDIHVRFTPVTVDQYEHWVGEQGKPRRIMTVMGRKLSAQQIAAVAAVCADHGLNIDVITRLSGRVSLIAPEDLPRACVQFSVSGPLAEEQAMRRAVDGHGPGDGYRHRRASGQHLSAQPAFGGVRHGFDVDPGGSDQRTGRGARAWASRWRR